MRGLHETVGEAEERMKDIDLTTEQIARLESRMSDEGKDIMKQLDDMKQRERRAHDAFDAMTVMLDKLEKALDDFVKVS